MFTDFKKLLQTRLDFLIEKSNVLYQVEVDKDEFWNLYLDSFPQGTNDIFRERREHDCSNCRNFIKNYGTLVGIVNGQKMTIWDISSNELKYSTVAIALDEKIKSLPITNVFYSKERKLGVDHNNELIDGTVKTWNHFYYELPATMVDKSSYSVESMQGSVRQTKEVIQRSLEELTMESINTVLELIDEKLLYKGEEYLKVIKSFKTFKSKYVNLKTNGLKSNFCWVLSNSEGRYLAIRNTAIGTLLVDLSEGVDVEMAVRKYEKVVAPQNYKRPKAIYTKEMVNKATEKLEKLGLLKSLGRRYAHLEDISITNVLWASVESEDLMKSPLDILMDDIKEVPNKYKHVEETDINTFIKDILPNSEKVELLLENKFNNNLVSLIAPKEMDSPSLFKWDNSFSWAYNGEFTDSIKESVKKRGGDVEGDLRCSLSWAEGDKGDNSDLDLHCLLPNGGHIYFSNRTDSNSGGHLDVDIMEPNNKNNKDIVENITWQNRNRMPKGIYKFFIRNFSLRGNQKGFSAEIEFDGKIFNFEYDKPLKNKEDVVVAELYFDGVNFEVQKSLPSTTSSKEIWNVSTMKFLPVSTVMYSPNYWNNQKGVGNRHYFFMLENCKNNGETRGFFNEYLKPELSNDKRVFEALGSKMRVDYDDNQLSGVGFSSTKNNTLIVRVDGKTMNINFNTKNEENGKESISGSSEKTISL